MYRIPYADSIRYRSSLPELLKRTPLRSALSGGGQVLTRVPSLQLWGNERLTGAACRWVLCISHPGSPTPRFGCDKLGCVKLDQVAPCLKSVPEQVLAAALLTFMLVQVGPRVVPRTVCPDGAEQGYRRLAYRHGAIGA